MDSKSIVAALVLVLAPVVASAQQTAGAAPVTFAKDIAPILQRSCQNCHRPNSAGPMPLISRDGHVAARREDRVRAGRAGSPRPVAPRRQPERVEDRVSGEVDAAQRTQPEPLERRCPLPGRGSPRGRDGRPPRRLNVRVAARVATASDGQRRDRCGRRYHRRRSGSASFQVPRDVGLARYRKQDTDRGEADDAATSHRRSRTAA